MARFVFLINTSNIPKRPRLFVNLAAGFLFLIGFLILAFSVVTLFPEITEEIGFHSKGKETFTLIAVIGVIFCAIAYFLAFIINYNWKREANKQLKYNEVFGGNSNYEISENLNKKWDVEVNHFLRKSGVINLVYFKGAFSNNLCFVDFRYVGSINKGGDYSLVIIESDKLKLSERKHFTKNKKAVEFLKEDLDNTLAFNLLNDLSIEVAVILEDNKLYLQQVHKFNKQELASVYQSVSKFF